MNRSELIGDIASEVSRVLGYRAKDDDLTAEDITTVRDAMEDVLDDAEKVIEETEDEDAEEGDKKED